MTATRLSLFLPALLCCLPLTAATSGALTGTGRDGQPLECPLRHTSVKADITGPFARVSVTQEFENTAPDTVEAVYSFPLPQHAAVDNMTMLIGDRTIRGIIKRREEARQIFDNARRMGQTASLLDQERPNLFTQAVTNIPPHGKVKIEIRYIEAVPFADGAYEFVVPMVVGPRYLGHARDPRRISPPVTPPGTRAGHDISVEVTLDAGVPLDAVASPTHEIALDRPSVHQAHLTLKQKNELPNKDFLLRYDVLGRTVQDAVFSHRAGNDGYFTLMLTPPERPTQAEIAPKELVFVLDTSGSMSGFPIEKAKESMKLAIQALNPRDAFNLITFAGETEVLFPQPVPATPQNVQQALQFLEGRSGRGGTEMMKAIRAAFSGASDRVRIICFMTDGYVGNETEILHEIQQHPNARVFAFGIGSAVNRFLLDGMAHYGRGEVEYVGLRDDGSAAAKRFHERVRNPLLTDIKIDWGKLPISDVYPKQVPDLFAAKPLVITGRYASAASGVIRISGRQAGRPFTREINVALPAAATHDALPPLWARAKIASLMAENWPGMAPRETGTTPQREAITQLGLQYSLMTPFTSFIAVEEKIVVEGGKPRRVPVPVEMPEGVSYDGIYGERANLMGAVGVVGGVPAGTHLAIAAPTFVPQQEAVRRAATPPPYSIAKLSAVSPNEQKLHPSLASRLNQPPTPITVQIWLRNVDEKALAELRKLGLTITKSDPVSHQVTGKMSSAKLWELVALTNVRYIGPA